MEEGNFMTTLNTYTYKRTLLSFGLALTLLGSQVSLATLYAESASNSADISQVQAGATIEVQDLHGTILVPFQPSRVVALDNRTFETLSDWGIELVAAPKDIMPTDSPYVQSDDVLNIGNHREPNLELLAAADPELVIVGQRFAAYYEEIKALVPNAAVIDFSWAVSDTAETPGENLINGFKTSTNSLAQIFGKEQEAAFLLEHLETALKDAKTAYNGQNTILSVIVSSGEIGFSAPHSGRVWGPLYELFDWQAGLALDTNTSDHTGDDISVEAIAQSNPDWLLILDRDAAITSDGDTATPATDVIEHAAALQNTTAIQKGQLIYAPADTYTNESIQTYIELFESITAAFSE